MEAKISTIQLDNNCAIQSPYACKEMFQQLLLKIQQTNWKDFLTQSIRKYSLETYKLNLLEPRDLSNLYQKLQSKYAVTKSQRMIWYQNELRIFIWLFATSEGILKTSPVNYKQEHFKELTKPFFKIHQHLCHYQYKLVLNSNSHRSWQSQQDLILSEIIKKHQMKGSWSDIAKSLFLLSHKQFFRTPQACRERYQNHLDNTKIRGQWTFQQDFLLIKYILSIGKKWSVIARYIGNTRTEHMVKNRFQSLIRQQIKSKNKVPRSSHQIQLCKTILKKLSSKQKKYDKIINQTQNFQKQIPSIQNQKSENNSNLQITNNILNYEVCEEEQFQIPNPFISKSSFQTKYSLNYLQPDRKQKLILFEENASDEFDWNRNDQENKLSLETELQLPLFIDSQIFFGNEACLFEE